MTELESAYSLLLKVFVTARNLANLRTTDKTDKTDLQLPPPVQFSRSLSQNNGTTKILSLNQSFIENSDNHMFTFDSLGEACFMISGKRLDDIVLENMFEEAASFRASDAGSVCMYVCV